MNKKILRISFFLSILVALSTALIYASDSKVLITADKAACDKWFKINSEAVPHLTKVNQAFRYQDLSLLVFFKEPGLDRNGRAKIYYDVKVISPDGSILVDQKHVKVIDGIISNDKIVRLSDETLQLTFEEPPGKYLVQVAVKDDIANTVQKHQEELEVKEYTYDKGLDNADASYDWMRNYYKTFTPEKALDGLLYFANTDAKSRNKDYYFICGFYSQFFNDNQYLIPHMLKAYPNQSKDERTLILSLLPYINYDFGSFIEQLSDNEKKFYNEWQAKCLKYPTDGVSIHFSKLQDVTVASYQMDMLWGTFFASGKYEPIRQLVRLLDLGQYKGNFNKYKEAKDTVYEEQAALDIIYQTAKWSIESNCKQHLLVKDYCCFAYDHENLPPQAKQELKEILGK